MEIKRKNHYIPQFYIKNWSKDGNSVLIHRFIVSNSKVEMWESKSVKGVGYYSDLYTDVIDDAENDGIEKWLEYSVETPVSPVIQKIRKGQKLIKEEYDLITKFVFSQHFRTPKFYKNNIDSWFKSTKDYLEGINLEKRLKEAEDTYFENIGDVKNVGDEHFPIKTELIPDEVNNQSLLKVETLVGKGYWLFAMKHLLINTLKILPEYKWSIYQAPSNFTWVTSDNPVIVLNYTSKSKYDFKGGWGKKNCNIICPISPDHLLIAQVEKKLPSYFNPTIDQAMEIQKLIIENADEFIISYNEIKNINQIRDRIVDKNYYKENINGIKNWIKEQKEVEREYKKKSSNVKRSQ